MLFANDGFREPGEAINAARLRTQEEIFQKASAALSDKVSISYRHVRSFINHTSHLYIL